MISRDKYLLEPNSNLSFTSANTRFPTSLYEPRPSHLLSYYIKFN